MGKSLMVSNTMQVFLKERLQACCIDGTRVRESGLTVSTEVLAGEIVLFFHIDSKDGRKNLNMTVEGSRICDYIVFYTKDSVDREIVCFLELKGKHLDEAVKQILSTYQRVQELSKEKIDKKQHQQITWKACIFLHGHAPRNGQSSIDRLIKELGGKKNILIRHGIKQYTLLGQFFRESTS